MNKALLDQFREMERHIADEKGRLNLFVVLLREELTGMSSSTGPTVTSTVSVFPRSVGDEGPTGPIYELGSTFSTERWELVASAPWIYTDKAANFRYFADKLRSTLGSGGMLSISRIVLLRPEAPVVSAFNAAYEIEHGNLELRNTNVFGVEVNRAYVITSQRLQPVAP